VLDDFLDGWMSGEEARVVRLHLASCAACASSLSLSEKIEMLPALDETIEPSEHFDAAFRARLQRRKRSMSPVLSKEEREGAWPFLRRPWRLAAVGALAALLVVGIFVRHLGDEANPPGNLSDRVIAENLNLLEDMAVINNLDLLENFDAIEEMTQALEGSKEQRSVK